MLAAVHAFVSSRRTEKSTDARAEGEDEDAEYASWDSTRTPLEDAPWLWERASQACGQLIAPASRLLHNTLIEDVELLTRLLAGLEHNDFDDKREVSQSSPSSSLSRAWSSTAAVTDVGDISSTTAEAPTIPRIVITPCPDGPPESSSLVPYQDAAFGARLVVPFHAAVNAAFPPLLPATAPPLPWAQHWPERRWLWHYGHWRVVLPSHEEQAKRGMYSRALPRKHVRRARPQVPSRRK